MSLVSRGFGGRGRVDHVIAFCDGGSTTNLALEEVTDGKAWLRVTFDGPDGDEVVSDQDGMGDNPFADDASTCSGAPARSSVRNGCARVQCGAIRPIARMS
ncbi:MAG: hypothetical protein QOG15_2832 [Solirubrobacteraceae bacterium]|jgi:hypothetical protein|nr:hypothetical protein [Solirubrobacteraceae bacterium]